MSEAMRCRFAAETARLLDDDASVALVLADISADRFEASARRHGDRVINVGIREQLLISAAAGLAHTGLRPVVHSIATFLVSRPYEQLKVDLGHQDLGAVLVSIGASYDYAAAGRTHHAPEDVALLDTLDGWTVHVPGHEDEAAEAIRAAVAAPGKVYVRLGEEQNHRAYPDATTRWQLLRRGTGATVVAVGPMLDQVLAATAGMDVSILYAAGRVRPVDAAALRGAVPAGGTVVLVEPYLAGTSVAAVSQVLGREPRRVVGLGVGRADLRRYGSPARHAAAHGLDPAGIRAALSA